MRARSSERGFTLPELIAVLIIVGVLAAVALPKFDAALTLRSDAWHDELVSGLRFAHQTATSHRRLVCATLTGGSLSLSIAATNPATSCDSTLPGPNGGAAYTSTSTSAVTLSPAGVLYFQPSGRVTSDGAGATTSDRTITIVGSDSVTVIGETGHVE